MPALTKRKLEEILTKRLRLTNPHFRLEKEGSMIFGSIISPTFRGKDDLKRILMIRKALEAELGKHSNDVGMILAYTPDEWSVGEEVPTGR